MVEKGQFFSKWKKFKSLHFHGMAKAMEFKIKEDISTLRSLRKRQTVFRKDKRLIWLVALKQKRFKTRHELADYLGVSTRVQERWAAK